MTLYQPHDRTYDHTGTEDCSTVVLSEPIGPYAAGVALCDVLADLQTRLDLLATDWAHGFFAVGLDAFIAPYSPGTLGGSLLGVFGIDAWILDLASNAFGLDAEIVSPTPSEIDLSFGLSAYINDVGGGVVAQLAADIDASQTTITVTTASGFPTSGDYLIQIDGEMMLVVGGQGTTTWTVIRGYNGTTATSHLAGAVVATC